MHDAFARRVLPRFPHRTLVTGMTLAFALGLGTARSSLHAQVVSAAPLTAAAAPDAREWIGAADVLRLALNRPLAPNEGRIAVIVGDVDWSGFTEVTSTSIDVRPAALGFPKGEHTVSVYLVDAGQRWQPIGQSTLRVLTPGGFEKAVVSPTIELGLAGQAALSRRPELPPTDRDTFQDLTVRAGLGTTLVRGGWTATTETQFVGVSEREQALRFATLQADAPRVDLASYRVGLTGSAGAFHVGHTTIGTHRLLLSSFASRGLAGTLRLGPVVDVSLAAVNGSTIVGYDNLFGLANRSHRIVNAAVGVELLPSRRGALRLEASLTDGSVLPFAGVNQGAILDAEKSRGVGVQVRATDAASRFQLDSGFARSRFTNPLDPFAPFAFDVVPVREATRDARYLDVSYALLQNARLGDTATASLTTAFRHHRAEPLYRSVALPVRADVEQNAFDVTGALGAFSSQLTFEQSRDNLAEIASILTTRSRQILWTSALPLHAFAGASTRAAAWPTISYSLTRVHQFGDGLPVGGLFDSLSQVPDQVSLNQTLSVSWQGAVWRGSYGLNRSLQDNRQPGRESADLLNLIHTFALGAMFSPRLDAGVELALEGAENREIVRTDLTRRISAMVTARPATRTSIAATLTRNVLEDTPRTSTRRTTDVSVTFTQGVALLRRAPDRLQGQFFVRYARQTIYGLLVGIVAPEDSRFWTLNTGLTFRIF